jgi:O-antigen ligase
MAAGIRSDMNKKDKVCRKIIECGILGVLIFSPLPAASVHEWSILAIQLAVVIMMAAYVLMADKPQPNPFLSQILHKPSYLFGGFFVLLILQVLPLPKFLVKILSPQTFEFYKNFSADFSEISFMSISVIPYQTIREGLEILAYVMLGFLIVRTVTSRKQIMRLFSVIVAMGIFEALYGFLELYSSNPRILFYKKVHYLDCVTGTFVNRNHLSGYLEMIIPVTVGLLIARLDLFSWKGMNWKHKLHHVSQRSPAWNVFLLLGIITMALAILFSKSRSGVFILIFSFILLFGLAALYTGRYLDEKKNVTNFLKIVFLLIVVLSLYAGMEATLARFSMDELLQDQRPVVWGNTVEIISDFPVFGAGLGTFASVYPVYEESGTPVRYSHAHNDYLEYLAETGIVGMALLLGGIIFILVKVFLVWKERRHPVVKGLVLGGIAAVVSILIHSITDFNLHIPANMILFTVILSATAVTAFYKKR